MTTKPEPINWQAIGLLLDQLPAAFNTRQAELHDLSSQLEELRYSHCTGSEHWRDTDNDNLKPKLYIIHRTNVSCPIHGQPEPGKRVRVYIGSNEAKIAKAQAAIERGKSYEEAMTKLRRLHQAIRYASHTLRSIYQPLNIDLPSTPTEEPKW